MRGLWINNIVNINMPTIIKKYLVHNYVHRSVNLRTFKKKDGIYKYIRDVPVDIYWGLWLFPEGREFFSH